MPDPTFHASYILPLLFMTALYFAPSLAALYRGHKDAGWIILFNALFGWSGVGWVAAMFWAV